MNVGDRVSITDPQRTHEGSVTAVKGDGMVTVKWDSGMTELLHRSELTKLGGAPPKKEKEKEKPVLVEEPKPQTFKERLSAFWNAITGK